MCLNKNYSDAFPVHNGLKQGGTLSAFLYNMPSVMHKKTRKDWN